MVCLHDRASVDDGVDDRSQRSSFDSVGKSV
jgi:hypothetical protein